MSITYLNTNIQKFTNIVHLADVHVKLTKRHQEYREVFDKLYESIKSTPITTSIFVIGDLFQNKNDLSPECVDLTAEFLFKLSELRPTILVAGNHDLLITNQNRMDSLSPIVTALNNPNLFYLKKSGLYSLGNICINNYSIFDSPENYIKGKDISQIYRNKYEYFVCLFHGQIDGSITDFGFKLSNPTISTNMFDGHEIILAGDIHKSQNLYIEKDINEEELDDYIKGGDWEIIN